MEFGLGVRLCWSVLPARRHLQPSWPSLPSWLPDEKGNASQIRVLTNDPTCSCLSCHQHHQLTGFHLPNTRCLASWQWETSQHFHCVNAQNHRPVARPARNSSPGSRGSREATAAVPHFPAKPPASAVQAPLSWLPPRNKANFRPNSSQGRNARFDSLKSWERMWRMAVAMANSKKKEGLV